MSELPPGWARATLGDVTTIVSGSTPKTGVAAFWGGDISWITPDDLSKNRRKTIAVGARSLTQAGHDSCSTTLMPPGSVLYSSRAPIGYAAIATGPVCTNQGFKSFVPSDAVTSDYLYWFLTHATPQMRRLGSGTTFPELSKKSAASVEIGLPPLNEQGRIVAAIEEHLSRLDAADTYLAAAIRQLTVIQNAVVAVALSEEWPVRPLRDVTESQVYGTSVKASDDASGVPVLRMGNIVDGKLSLSSLKYLPADHPDVERLALRPGDILFNRTNSPELVGKSAVFTTSERMTFASYLIRVRLTSDCDPRWVALAINSPRGRRYVAQVRTQQVGQANVNGSKLAAMPIPLPPLEEQRQLVVRVEEHLSAVDALRAAIERAQRRSVALRRGVLERAFRGGLVSQDPSDEPASALLEQIRAEREAAPPQPRRKATA